MVEVLSLDEIATHRGHGRYLLVVSAPELGLVLDMLKDRHKKTLLTWFDQRGIDWCARVQVCRADMWKPYHDAVQAKLPDARLIVDRFYVKPGVSSKARPVKRPKLN